MLKVQLLVQIRLLKKIVYSQPIRRSAFEAAVEVLECSGFSCRNPINYKVQFLVKVVAEASL